MFGALLITVAFVLERTSKQFAFLLRLMLLGARIREGRMQRNLQLPQLFIPWICPVLTAYSFPVLSSYIYDLSTCEFHSYKAEVLEHGLNRI